MDQSEEGVAQWLCSKGHKICHLTDGDDPPDFVVDGDIAVEVTTISTGASQSIYQFFNKLCRALGSAENGRGYFVSVEYEDERMFEAADEGKKKAELRRLIRQELKAHYRNTDSGIRPAGRNVIALPYGITLEIWPWQRLSDDPVEHKYTVDRLVLSKGEALVKKIQAAIDAKSSKRSIQERTAKYREWWLVVTGFSFLLPNELKILSDTLVLRAPWKHLFGFDGTILKSQEDGDSEGS